MRVTLAALAAALAFASAAYANNPPIAPTKSPTLNGLRVIAFGTTSRSEDRLRSCLANQVGSRGVIGRAARKLLPVACEQPPRANLAIIALLGG
ncbi:MAG TPA: hypothetical protein VLE97_00465 [Gaiellaceae bacterium]|nr:hypothetical protein [Gaiellaceae bacterium]